MTTPHQKTAATCPHTTTLSPTPPRQPTRRTLAYTDLGTSHHSTPTHRHPHDRTIPATTQRRPPTQPLRPLTHSSPHGQTMTPPTPTRTTVITDRRGYALGAGSSRDRHNATPGHPVTTPAGPLRAIWPSPPAAHWHPHPGPHRRHHDGTTARRCGHRRRSVDGTKHAPHETPRSSVCSFTTPPPPPPAPSANAPTTPRDTLAARRPCDRIAPPANHLPNRHEDPHAPPAEPTTTPPDATSPTDPNAPERCARTSPARHPRTTTIMKYGAGRPADDHARRHTTHTVTKAEPDAAPHLASGQ